MGSGKSSATVSIARRLEASGIPAIGKTEGVNPHPIMGGLSGQLETEWPYARRRGLAGLDGLIALYRQYRALTDRLFAELDMPKIGIENSPQQWALYDDIIDRSLTNPT